LISLMSWFSRLVSSENIPKWIQFLTTLAAFILFILSVATSQFTRLDYDSSFAVLPNGDTVTVPQSYQYTGLTDYSVVTTAYNVSGNVTYTYQYLWPGYNYTTADILNNITNARTAVYTGLFYSCIHDSTGRTCRLLNTDCQTRDATVTLPQCDQFNAIKAFAILSILVTGLSLIFRVLNTCAKSKNVHSLSGVLNFAAFLFSTVAISVGLNYVADALAVSSSHLGYSAALLVVAWLLSFRLFLMWSRETPRNPQDHKDGPYIC